MTTKAYDDLLARKMAESEKKRGYTHTQMTPQETQSEIERIQDGAKSIFEEETHAGEKGEFTAKFGLGRVPHIVKYEISVDGKSVNIDAPHTDIMGNLGTLQPGQSLKVTGIPEQLQPIKKRRGRPPGSRNKPKVNQGEVK